MPVIASAPAKLILCGEHAVVYGQPAIAVPIAAIRARATVRSAPAGSGLCIEAHDLAQTWRLNDDVPVLALLRRVLEQLGASEPDLTIELQSTIPIASGMGSSAALATALVRALAEALGKPLAPSAISAFVYESERAFHGTPSGIDNTVVAYEQPVWFQRLPDGTSVIEPLHLGRPLDLVVGDTGMRSETRAVVGDLRRRWQEDPAPYEQCFAAIGALVYQVRAALANGDPAALGPLLDQNQSYLSALDISSPELDRLVMAARTAGALGAKLSGAGWGGAMLALAPNAQTAQAIAEALRGAGAAYAIVTQVRAAV